MNRFLMLTGAIVGLATFGPQAGSTARADAGAPYCATINSLGGGSPQCDYFTYQQCLATISGLPGYCSMNLAASSNAQMSARKTRR